MTIAAGIVPILYWKRFFSIHITMTEWNWNYARIYSSDGSLFFVDFGVKSLCNKDGRIL